MCTRLLRRGLVAVITALALLVASAAPASAGTFTAGTLTISTTTFPMTGTTVGGCTTESAWLSLALVGSTASVTDFYARIPFVIGLLPYVIVLDDTTAYGPNTGTRSGSAITNLHLGIAFHIYTRSFWSCTTGSLVCEGRGGFWMDGTATGPGGTYSLSVPWLHNANVLEPGCQAPFASWTGLMHPNGWAGTMPWI